MTPEEEEYPGIEEFNEALMSKFRVQEHPQPKTFLEMRNEIIARNNELDSKKYEKNYERKNKNKNNQDLDPRSNLNHQFSEEQDT